MSSVVLMEQKKTHLDSSKMLTLLCTFGERNNLNSTSDILKEGTFNTYVITIATENSGEKLL